ncbi:hypothetical protein JTB14_034104 [Gonioctena quinquepunctata]|nr:hypothetical protein JTB14_034104 [Gonioctena quinquepunctata]
MDDIVVYDVDIWVIWNSMTDEKGPDYTGHSKKTQVSWNIGNHEKGGDLYKVDGLEEDCGRPFVTMFTFLYIGMQWKMSLVVKRMIRKIDFRIGSQIPRLE